MASDLDAKLVTEWLAQLDQALTDGDAARAASLFGPECYWRDLVSLTWNIYTAEGRGGIAAMLGATLPATGPGNLALTGEPWRNDDGDTEAWFTFETRAARGKGHLRLRAGHGFTLLTTMTEIKGHEERSGPTRELGLVHKAIRGRDTWSDRRNAEHAALGTTEQPYCVIIGGGQGGIMLGARLKRLGVPTIILEKHARPGDSWRSRYRSLVLHDPVWYDHLPYIPFPDHWPVFTPKDQMGDWLEAYTRLMDLHYWGASPCMQASWDAASKQWTLTVDRQGTPVTLRPKQLVLATGSYGPPRVPKLSGQDVFAGRQLHSAQYQTGADFAGQNCVVVGANSSAHDVAADLWEQGAASVTMLQRSPTTVVRSETLLDLAFGPLYSEAAKARGITTEQADLTFASTPFRLFADAQAKFYKQIIARDADLIARLNAVGFRTDYGADQSGLMMKALRTGSGYYIDVGCSELIATRQITVESGVQIAQLERDAVVLDTGKRLPADAIIYATGYQPMTEAIAALVSREMADRIGPNWGYGSGFPGDPGPWCGELRNMWKPLPQEALWFHGGNLHLSRHYSLYVALQIKARQLGLPTPIYHG